MKHDEVKGVVFCNGLRHTTPQPDLCPSKGNIKAGACEKPQINSKDEDPLKQYPQCDICFQKIRD